MSVRPDLKKSANLTPLAPFIMFESLGNHCAVRSTKVPLDQLNMLIRVSAQSLALDCWVMWPATIRSCPDPDKLAV